MRVTIVGSGTLIPDDRHRSAGHLVEWDRGSGLLDCGSGVVHGLERDGLAWQDITHVLITHFHTDHFGDLPALLWAWRYGRTGPEPRTRTLIGPMGLNRVLRALEDAFGRHVRAPGGDLVVVELGPGQAWQDSERAITVRTHGTRHTPESIAYRLETPEGQVGYTGDTGPQPSLGSFFRGVDLLISECSTPDSEPMEHHLSPTSVASLACDSAPETLCVTHLYPSVDRAGLAGRIQSLGYHGVVHVAEDGTQVRI